MQSRRLKTVLLELIHVVLPMLVGGFTYLLFRSDTLLMFQWVDFVGMSEPLADARLQVSSVIETLPDWFLFSLPDAAWLYAFGAQMVILHRESTMLVRASWVLLAPAMAIGAELGQAMGLVPGTFDILDLLFLSLITFGVVAFVRSVDPRRNPAVTGEFHEHSQ